MGLPRWRSVDAVGTRHTPYGTWIACCLGRGKRAPLSNGDIAPIADEIGGSDFAGGTFVVRRGETSAQVHVLRSGTIELSREINGLRVALQILQPGDLFGEVPALLSDPEPFDALAIEDCTVLPPDANALFKTLHTRDRDRTAMVRLTRRADGRPPESLGRSPRRRPGIATCFDPGPYG